MKCGQSRPQHHRLRRITTPPQPPHAHIFALCGPGPIATPQSYLVSDIHSSHRQTDGKKTCVKYTVLGGLNGQVLSSWTNQCRELNSVFEPQAKVCFASQTELPFFARRRSALARQTIQQQIVWYSVSARNEYGLHSRVVHIVCGECWGLGAGKDIIQRRFICMHCLISSKMVSSLSREHC